ncbi:PIR Superfamily Protein [Plasmodium ovale wallikeri]|uniref:PIR protein n=2 Tax=Plasmodium ovale TaxID=36330 RepID=A0A1C3KH83_PLAOA|nr:PIR Superfamily Protein [Plasmodium ovale wallikeri]SBT73036.1 PIR protein [Plasmodium ovale]
MSDTDAGVSSLPSNIFYSRLDRIKADYIPDNHEFWNNFIKNTYIKNTSISDILINAFQYVSYLKESDTFYKERWNYLYFWVGYKVIQKLGYSSFANVIDVLKVVKERIHQVKYEYDIFNITSDNFNDLKKIYDFFQNYDSIDLSIGAPNSDCTAKYKEYVDSCFELYKNVKRTCELKEDGYCKIFKHFLKIYKKEELKQLTCSGTKPPQPVVEREYTVHLHDTEADLGEGVQGMEAHMQIYKGGIYDSSHSDNMMSTFFPILGIFSVLFLLYNFTPFRLWLHNIISNKKIIQHNHYEDENEESFEIEYEKPLRNNQYNRHDVSYHSIINP